MMIGIILAAGSSSRFQGIKPKSLYSICGQEIIKYNVDLLRKYTSSIYVVISEKDLNHFQKVLDNVTYIFQNEPKGTADALNCVLEEIKEEGTAFVCNADTFILDDFIPPFLLNFLISNAKASLLAVETSRPGSAIIRKNKTFFIDESNTNHLFKNSGYYLFDIKSVKEIIHEIPIINNEYYITKIFELLKEKSVYEYPYSHLYFSINTKNDYKDALERVSLIIIENLKANDVTIIGNCLVDYKACIDKNSTLINSTVLGNTIIKENCYINNSIIENSLIDQNVSIGPYSHIRDNCHIYENVFIGNFVEMKNTIVGSKTKIKHQSLLNDCIIGTNVNIGAGCISANYNGKEKNKIIIKEKAFIGSNTTLVAPLIIEKNALVAAGSTITSNVPANNLAIARKQQENKQRKMNI